MFRFWRELSRSGANPESVFGAGSKGLPYDYLRKIKGKFFPKNMLSPLVKKVFLQNKWTTTRVVPTIGI